MMIDIFEKIINYLKYIKKGNKVNIDHILLNET